MARNLYFAIYTHSPALLTAATPNHEQPDSPEAPRVTKNATFTALDGLVGRFMGDQCYE